ncbi:MAG: anion transporter [Candidatus Hydrogenedentes bacterium]|nr:anion transporter [Candidatus Hydrogenedentota bacterium]
MTFVVLIFGAVYLGMMLGRFPRLAMDRTGIALLGAVALIAGAAVTPEDAWRAIDPATIALLFGLMVVSAQFRLGGFYSAVTRLLAEVPLQAPALLAAVLAVVAVLSALLTNDIICLAMAPLLADGCARRNLNPVPFLLGLACAANIGSAATLIGNPQNILIGQALDLSFAGYMLTAMPVVLAGLAVVWGVLLFHYRTTWRLPVTPVHPHSPPFNPWQTGKGLLVIAALMAAFLFTSWPHDVVALAGAGVLLISRRLHTRDMLGLVDWQLLVLFAGLFIVNHAFVETGAMTILLDEARVLGIDPTSPPWLFTLSAVLSNLVSNVPATMLLLPAAVHERAGAILALSSTLAGNLVVVGSIANIIVVEQARLCGVHISWGEHAKTGIPVTLLTLGIAAAWLAMG